MPQRRHRLDPHRAARRYVAGRSDHVAALGWPVFIIGGAEDRHTTEAETRSLYDRAPEPKQLWSIPGAAHVDFFDAAGDEHRRRLLEFLSSGLNGNRSAY